jgi:hypothetical protein
MPRLAMQAVLVEVLSQLRAADPHLTSSLLLGLNDARTKSMMFAIKFGAAAGQSQTRSVQLRRRIVGLVERIERNRNRSTRNR